MHLATARAHRRREDFQEFYHLDTGQAPGHLRSWCYGAKRSRLQPVKDFVRLVESHRDGIVGWHDSRISNGLACLLVWVVVVANAMAMLVQYLAAKVGVVTGKDLPELCREHFPRTVSIGLWAQAELIAMATDLAEFVGAAVGLNLLFGVP